MEYNNISSLFGVGRILLWFLVLILQFIASIMENTYNHIFKLFEIMYSDEIVGFISNWMGFLWIPIAVATVILGYNLITSEEGEGSKRAKTYMKNLCLLLLISIGIPYLFIGYKGSTSSPNVVGPVYVSGDPELTTIFAETENNGNSKLINGVRSMAGGNNNVSNTQQTIVECVYDLQSIFNQVSEGNTQMSSDWSHYLESGTILQNDFYEDKDTIVNASAVLSISPWECIQFDTVKDDAYYSNSLTIEDIAVDGYDYCAALDCDTKFSYDIFLKSNAKPNYDNLPSSLDTGGRTGEVTNDNIEGVDMDTPARTYLFQIIHSYHRMDIDDDGDVDFIMVNNSGKTKTDNWLLPDIGNTYPFRYHIEWGMLIVKLSISIAVLFLTSLKIAKIIYELTVNQLLVLFFGASDLNNGQRTREILKSIFSLAASAFFAVILVQFYYLLTDAIKDIHFSDDMTTNGWMQTLCTFFIGVATIKGPSALEKALGISGGLSDEWRDMGAVNRAARPVKAAALGAAYGATRLAGKAAKAAGGATMYGASKVAGKISQAKQEKAARAGNPKDSISKSGAKARNERAGDSSQFAAARNQKQVKKESGKNSTTIDTKDFSTKRDATGQNAANEAMAGQGRDINDMMQKDAKSLDERQKVSEDYRGNIQNAALAEQTKNGYDDREALERAYQGSGFTEDEASQLANRDLMDGSWDNKKEKFENSISASAQQKLSDSPLSYDNQMEAYKEAAEEHYGALGFNRSESREYANNTASRVCLEDNQKAIRNEAKTLMDSNPDMTEREAVETAIRNDVNGTMGRPVNRSNGDYDKAVDTVLASGSLKDGVVKGRTYNNEQQKKLTTNTRTGNLHNARVDDVFTPGVDAALNIATDYNKARSAKTIVNSGFESGKRSQEQIQAHKDWKREYDSNNKNRSKNQSKNKKK